MTRTIQIPFGKGFQTLHVPEERLRAVISPKHGEEAPGDASAIVQAALEAPIASPRLKEIAADKNKILVITSDHTRPVPSRVTMPLLLKEIRSGNPQAQITILIATGMHRDTTPAEMNARFGEEIVRNEKIVVHHARNDAEMAYFGVLPSGGELWLNHLVKEADLVVSEGFIEPHFFAGFSGGRKSILPGVAAARSVRYNHNATFIASPKARQGILDGNPIHKDMAWAAQAAGLRFILNVTLNEKKEVTAAFAGDPIEAHRQGCEKCLEHSRVEPVVSDIAITSNGGYPLDQNLYQSVKGMTAAEKCVRQGGRLILCAEVSDGHGGEAFYRWFADRQSAEEVEKDILDVRNEDTEEDQWMAQILARIMRRASIIYVTGEKNRKLVEDMHMTWAPDADTALKMATDALGENAGVTVIPDGVQVTL